MAIRAHSRLLAAGGLALWLGAGCAAIGGDEEGGGAGPDADVFNPDDDDDDDGEGDVIPEEESDVDADTIPDFSDNCPDLANTDQNDGDGDSIGNVCDCDPDDGDVVGYRIVEDDMSADRGMMEVPLGFTPANWTYSGGAYRQNRLTNDSTDASLFLVDHPLANVLVEGTVASTEFASYGDDDLRQIFFLARADVTDKLYSGIGCGIEVVEGLTPTQKTSAVTFAGSPSAINMSVVRRTSRAAVNANEQLGMRMEVRGTEITCTVTLDGTDVTSATGTVPDGAGRVGFHTRETKALFKSIRVCELK